MELFIPVQMMNFLKTLLFGIIIFTVYDLFRFIRSIFRCGTAVIFIQDIFYFFAVTVAALIFIFAVNDGEVRIYILAGIFLGWLVGYSTIGRLSGKVLKKCRIRK